MGSSVYYFVIAVFHNVNFLYFYIYRSKSLVNSMIYELSDFLDG
jgi:hypothetical protein